MLISNIMLLGVLVINVCFYCYLTIKLQAHNERIDKLERISGYADTTIPLLHKRLNKLEGRND